MSRLVIVSNRIADLHSTTQSGGLAVALADAMRKRGGMWMGWSGKTVRALPDDASPHVEDIGKVRVLALPLPEQEFDDYYSGYANSVLWPLFHYRLDLIHYNPAFPEAYHAINRRFARALAPHLREDDLVWVQDYHLIPVGHYLRQLGCRQRLGFFLHIPFPPADLLEASPEHAELVETLLAYDVAGFQTRADVNNMHDYLHHRMGLVPDANGFVESAGRRTFIGNFPIGIDVDAFRKLAADTPGDVAFDQIRHQVLNRKQIIGIDRLDYSKGLPQRVQAIDRLLQQHPEMEGRFSLLQISPPTRCGVKAYDQIRTELERLTGAVNGRWSDFNWTPIRYIHRTVPRDRLASMIRVSDVGFVTPLRDGMNLVAKEFVAAQDPDDPGVLVLSRFAGAAEDLTAAVIVNPYDLDDMARKLHDALVMPLDERRERHEALIEAVRETDIASWFDAFLARLEAPSAHSQTEARLAQVANA
ncbi:alpha,alpha-trehalose-phosphate synthase (UDP-forming) [Oricola thermophila]|uniref:Trehalose-6-phosphate synthase n=1 Tax=Oricola thermophila TaxID=2742145 RepID=A0A6N1VFN4_9HYPH|nr:trehalose-6-phosphate synthase [Oricola thermophila]QKV17777.1 trehalose-6-phosphate synthase [Oricola thermophila]